MATKKKRAAKKGRRVSYEGVRQGRRKELKRFEMESWVHDSSHPGMRPNEIAFVVRTSGGTSLNPTDTGKILRALQHEMRVLGHKLKRKGQDLDPAPKEPKTEKVTQPTKGGTGIAASSAVVGSSYLVEGEKLVCAGTRPRGRGHQVGFRSSEQADPAATKWIKGKVIVVPVPFPVRDDVGPEPKSIDAKADSEYAKAGPAVVSSPVEHDVGPEPEPDESPQADDAHPDSYAQTDPAHDNGTPNDPDDPTRSEET